MLYPQIRGKSLKHLKLLSQCDPAHFHQSQWEIQSQYRHSMFISANLFCSLRIFFSWLFLLQERAKKKKKEKKKRDFPNSAFHYLSHICKWCVAWHAMYYSLTPWVHITQLISVETIFHYFGFSYPFHQVQSSLVPFYLVNNPKVPSQPKMDKKILPLSFLSNLNNTNTFIDSATFYISLGFINTFEWLLYCPEARSLTWLIYRVLLMLIKARLLENNKTTLKTKIITHGQSHFFLPLLVNYACNRTF